MFLSLEMGRLGISRQAIRRHTWPTTVVETLGKFTIADKRQSPDVWVLRFTLNREPWRASATLDHGLLLIRGVHPHAQRVDSKKPVAVPPLRRPIEDQAEMLRSWIRQTMNRAKVDEMWISQIFQSLLDNIPVGPDVDVAGALRYLASKGEVAIPEKVARTYRTWWGEIFQEDIRFKVRNLH